MRILLVEDERKVANFVARTLRENAYAVDVADTGEKALELAREGEGVLERDGGGLHDLRHTEDMSARLRP